jgi:hypothetical protein
VGDIRRAGTRFSDEVAKAKIFTTLYTTAIIEAHLEREARFMNRPSPLMKGPYS